MYIKKTLLDCLQSLADRHDNGTLPTSSATLSFWTRILNRGVLYCADKMRINKSTPLTVSSGTVVLPDDFLLINNVQDSGGIEYTMVDPSDIQSRNGLVYWITGNQTDGFYLNTPQDGVFTVDYVYRPALMVSNSDICVIPDIEAVSSYAYSFIRKGESDPFNDADKALQECDSRLSEMISAYSINTDAIGFTTE